ncbi:hypothetical protein QBC39DRAFT_435362 [Podospora conica]|nr:hypothetical protein QBC39DRAFT_435362 [Schizothecium conicum]
MFLSVVTFFLVCPVLLEARAVAGPLAARGQDSQLIFRYSESGNCFGYFGPKNDALSFAPCKVFCPKKFPGSDPNRVGCKGPGMAAEAYPDKSMISKDEAGLRWVPGTCVCAPALEIADVILHVVVDGLKLDSITCAVMLSTLQLFSDTALDSVPISAPVGAAATAARIVEGAKTFVENGIAAASLFGDWIGPACKIPEFGFDLTRTFLNIQNSSDDLGVSKGCFKENKADCTKPAAVPRKARPAPPDPSPPKVRGL